MPAARQQDIEIRKGSTFSLAVRWETEPWVYAAITSISRAAPAAVTSSPHSLPEGWAVAVVDAKGLTQLNAKNNPPRAADMRRARVISSTEIEFNDVSTAGASTAHIANTGYLAWRTPQSLDGFSARMTIKDRIGGLALHSITSQAGMGIVLDDAKKVIELTIPAETTAAFLFARGVYDLEMVSPGGIVTPLLEGQVLISGEVTTLS